MLPQGAYDNELHGASRNSAVVAGHQRDKSTSTQVSASLGPYTTLCSVLSCSVVELRSLLFHPLPFQGAAAKPDVPPDGEHDLELIFHIPLIMTKLGESRLRA